MKCPNCGAEVKGNFKDSIYGTLTIGEMEIPVYLHKCELWGFQNRLIAGKKDGKPIYRYKKLKKRVFTLIERIYPEEKEEDKEDGQTD